ncbi:MAG: hypothetical protein ACQERZ_00915 [Fusobacteriota bacterium]
MRNKMLRVLFIFIILTTSLLGQDEYDLGEKEVIGVDEREYKEEIELSEYDPDSEELILNEELKVEEDLENDEYEIATDSIDIETNDREYKLNYNINLYSKPKNANVIVQDRESMKGNHLTFALGGYDKIDAFKYIFDYTRRESDDFTYFLHIGREIKGEDRPNDDQSIDNYYGQFWYKKLNTSISHTIDDEKLPGIAGEDVDSSYKKSKDTTLQLNYKALDQDLVLNSMIQNLTVNSNESKRQYDKYTFNGGIEYNVSPYEVDILDGMENRLTLNFDYHIDRIDTTQISSLKLVLDDKFKVNRFEKWDANLKVGLEMLIDNKNDQNHLVQIDLNRSIKDDFNFNFGIKNERFYKDSSYKLEAFTIDNDILTDNLLDLEMEENFEIKAGIEYTKNDYYVNGNLRHIISKDKIIYYQDAIDTDSDGTDEETVIRVDNANGKEAYQELELVGGYTYNQYRGKFTYTFNTLSDLPFLPQNKVKLNLIYEQDKLKMDLEGEYVSEMYGNKGETEKLKGYKELNLYNSYAVNDRMTLKLDFFNLLNVTEDIKKGYPKPSRKIMMEIKIKY